jgi:hypothetical protein
LWLMANGNCISIGDGTFHFMVKVVSNTEYFTLLKVRSCLGIPFQ